MKSSGIVGLVGGILLLICPFVLLGTAVNTAATTLNGGATAGAFSGVALLLNALKIANLVLGIIAIIGGSLFLATLKKFKSEE